MRKFAVIFNVALLFSLTAYCQHPYNQNLGGIAVITFPDTPKQRIISAEKFYVCDYNKSKYIAAAMPLTASLKDLIIGDDFDSLYNSFIGGVKKKIRGPIIYKNRIIINNLNGLEFGFKSISNGRTYFSHQRLLYVNDVLINYSFLSADSLQKNDKKVDSFFKTFKLTISEYEIRQRNAAKWGHIVGKVIVALIGIGLVVLIGFRIYSSTKN